MRRRHDREQIAATIVALKKEGLSILLSEQNIHFARLVCGRVYVIEKGQIRWHGSMPQLDDNLEVQRAYLTVWFGRTGNPVFWHSVGMGLSPDLDPGHDFSRR
jgi:ABC-type uncharacterized transport system ATPase subunit